MPLPTQALTLHGGCNCRAIRYRITIPPIASRPLIPSSTSDNMVHLPMIATDHCNDCRTATGSILPTWICVPAEMMVVSVRPAPSGGDSANPKYKYELHRDQEDGEGEGWRPAMEVLKAGSPPAVEESTLRFFHSSPKRTRTFCGHCGTNLTYAIWPMLEGYPDIFDTILGTVDRADLEQEWLVPERQCWWDKGIPWVQRLSVGGLDTPRHPMAKVNETIE